jgi:hypothetical protein
VKIEGKVCRTETVEGSIPPAALLALVRQTFDIPEGATATFHALDSQRMTGLLQAQINVSGYMPSAVVQIDETNPLRFRVSWSLPLGEKQG